MTTHEYLSQLFGIEDRILRKYEEAEACRNRAMRMQSMQIKDSTVKSSPNLHKTEDAIIQALEDEKEYMKLSVMLGRKKKIIIEQIDNLGNHLFTTILTKYYLYDQTFNEIGIDMKRSAKCVRGNYKKALDCFERKYGKQYL